MNWKRSGPIGSSVPGVASSTVTVTILRLGMGGFLQSVVLSKRGDGGAAEGIQAAVLAIVKLHRDAVIRNRCAGHQHHSELLLAADHLPHDVDRDPDRCHHGDSSSDEQEISVMMR